MESALARAEETLVERRTFGLTTFLLSRDGRIAALPGASNP